MPRQQPESRLPDRRATVSATDWIDHCTVVHPATARTCLSPLWLSRPTNNSNALASTTSFLQVANTYNVVEKFVFRRMVMHQHPMNISFMSTQQRVACKLGPISYVKILDRLMSESKSRQMCDAYNRRKTGMQLDGDQCHL